jgi:hypothetical protein
VSLEGKGSGPVPGRVVDRRKSFGLGRELTCVHLMNDDRLRHRSWTLARLCASTILSCLDRGRGDEGLVGPGGWSRVWNRQEAGGGRSVRTGRTSERCLGNLRAGVQVGRLRVVGVLLNKRRNWRKGLVRRDKRVCDRGPGTTGARGRVVVRVGVGTMFDSESRGRVSSSAPPTVKDFSVRKEKWAKRLSRRTLAVSSTHKTQ